MGHVTLSTPIRGYFVILRLTLDTFYLHTKFGNSCFSCSILGITTENGSYDPDHDPFRVFCHEKARLNIVYLNAKFDDSSFSRSRDIIRHSKVRNGSRDPDHAPFKADLLYICWDLIQPTCAQNLITLSSAVPKI